MFLRIFVVIFVVILVGVILVAALLRGIDKDYDKDYDKDEEGHLFYSEYTTFRALSTTVRLYFWRKHLNCSGSFAARHAPAPRGRSRGSYESVPRAFPRGLGLRRGLRLFLVVALFVHRAILLRKQVGRTHAVIWRGLRLAETVRQKEAWQGVSGIP